MGFFLLPKMTAFMKSLYVYHFVAEETVCADVPRASPLFRTFSTLYESLLILKMMDYILYYRLVVVVFLLLLLLLLQRCILQKFQKLCERRLYIYKYYMYLVSE